MSSDNVALLGLLVGIIAFGATMLALGLSVGLML